MKQVAVILITIPILLAASSPKMRIGYYGHSMFEIVLPSGVRIVTDPFVPDPSIQSPFPTGIQADIVVMSHNHTDHSNSAGVAGSPDLISWSSGTSHGIQFIATPVRHFPGGGIGQNNIMTWEASGLKFNHMGDYGDTALSDSEKTVLSGSDMLFIPAGGAGTTIDAVKADVFITQTQPRVSFPMHIWGLTLEDINSSFTHPVTILEGYWIAVDPDKLPEGTVIWELRQPTPSSQAELAADLEATSVKANLKSGSYTFTLDVKNNTARALNDASCFISVYDSNSLVFADTGIIDLLSNGTAQFESMEYEPASSQEYTLFGEVVYPADGAPQNDTVSAKANLSGTEEFPLRELLLEIRHGERGVVFFDYSAPSSGARLSVYDVSGKLVDFFSLEPGSGKSLRYESCGLLRSGVYFARLYVDNGSLTRKFIVY